MKTYYCTQYTKNANSTTYKLLEKGLHKGFITILDTEQINLQGKEIQII